MSESDKLGSVSPDEPLGEDFEVTGVQAHLVFHGTNRYGTSGRMSRAVPARFCGACGKPLSKVLT